MRHKFICKGCSSAKEQNYKGQDKAGNNIYLDEHLDRWYGHYCYQCHVRKCREAYVPKVRDCDLLITKCLSCLIDFKQKTTKQIYCSTICTRKQYWKKKKENNQRKCNQCSVIVPHGLMKFCSNECRKASKPIRIIKPFIEFKCIICSVNFKSKDSDRKYCSKKCNGQAKRVLIKKKPISK